MPDETNKQGWTCSACGRDVLEDHSRWRSAIAAHVVSEHVDPGGRELGLRDGRRVRLSDMCNACDARTIAEVLGLPYP